MKSVLGEIKGLCHCVVLLLPWTQELLVPAWLTLMHPPPTAPPTPNPALELSEVSME